MNESVPGHQKLPKGYQSWWAEVAGHLGGVYPFQDRAKPEVCSLDIGTIIEARRARGERVALDPVALAGKATLPYLLGNRTLLEGVQRAPWMAYPNSDGSWRAAPLPGHGQERPDPDRFVEELKRALLDEARAYLKGAATVGILLSGGMDSRVVAGVVRALQEEAGGAFSVVGLTWGRETSRDVVYARRIAERFGWEWQHFPITAETLAANIGLMGQMGAEVSPLHLHAMPEVARVGGLDVVLAGSYGDSVGRAEFSGRRVTQLRPVLPRRLDRFGVLRAGAVAAAAPELRMDAVDTPHLDQYTPALRRREIEQEMHYMRRMLQSCMLSIAREKRFYQLFTAPEVFGRMWALDPAIRDDAWYSRLLPRLPGNLLEIPWARTGSPYGRPTEQPDGYSRLYHAYGVWLRGELREVVMARVNSERIRGLGLFSDSGLDRALHAWARAGTSSTNSLDELVSWLASLHDFLEHYRIAVEAPLANSSWRDGFNALRGGLLARLYVEARERLRD